MIMTTQTLTIQEPQDFETANLPARQQAKGHEEWLAQWVEPDALSFEITDQEGKEMAIQVISEIKSRAKLLDAAEKEFTRPLLGVIERLRDVFRPAKKLAAQGEAAWKEKVISSDRKRMAAQADAARVVEAALAVGNTQAAIVAHAQIKPIEAVVGASVRKSWKVKRVALDLLPEQYKTYDLEKIEAAKKAQLAASPDEAPVIPGVVFELVETLAVRA